MIAALDARLGEIINATATTGLFRLIELRREFSTTLHHFLNPGGTANHAASFTLSPDHLPYVFRGRTITLSNVTAILQLTDPGLYENGQPLALTLVRAGGAPEAQNLLTAGAALGGLPHAAFATTGGVLGTAEPWTMSVPPAAVSALPAALRTTVEVGGVPVPRIRADLIKDIALLVHYSVS